MFYDYHVHSSFSTDCDIEMKVMIENAINKGIKEIAFTDHIDYDYPDKSITFLLDFDKYMDSLNNYSKKYKEKIKVVSGIEIGIQNHIINECNNIVDTYDFDFIMCSLHASDKKDLHNGDYFIDKSSKEIYHTYYNDLLYCIKNFKKFNVVGHINLIDRYIKYIKKPLSLLDYIDILEEIFKILIEQGKGIEINTSSFKYHLNHTIPTIDMLRLYKKLGGEIITTGSDAHFPDYIAYKFDYIYDILENIGFKYITTFNKMQPSFVKINK